MFLLNFENELLYKVYSEYDNYKIILNGNDNKRALVIFSSNSLYFPNEEQTFRNVIIERGRFEGDSLCKNPKIEAFFGKIILVRDVFKAHYTVGISAKVNSFEKLVDFLKAETPGYEVYCMGGSAGGYAATLAGALLDAKAVINTSGQWRIDNEHYSTHPLIAKGRESEDGSVYYNIIPYVKKSKVKVYYFYPNMAKEDLCQLDYLKEYDPQNVFIYPIKSKVHGETLSGKNIPYILTGDMDKLSRLSRCGRSYNRYVFMSKTAGVMPAVTACVKNNLDDFKFNAKIKVHELLVKFGIRNDT